MGERVTRILIRAFRGVRGEFALDFPQGESAVLFGENGTGKSTVADALEWYFTGRIDFLQREGREKAVRHIGAGEDQTSVTVECTGELGGTLVLGREPEPHVKEAGRETFLLRGRTLTAFIESTKGEKWKELAEILGLDEVDGLRLDLQRAKNDLHHASQQARDELAVAVRSLQTTVPVVDEARILEAISRRCQQAGIHPPDSLETALHPAWSSSLTSGVGIQTAALIDSLGAELRAWSPALTHAEAVAAWNQLVRDPAETSPAHIDLFQAAKAVLARTDEVGRCPLCRQPVDTDALRGEVARVLADLHRAASRLQDASDSLRQAQKECERREAEAGDFHRRAAALGIAIPVPPGSPAADVGRARERRETMPPEVLQRFEEALTTWRDEALAAVRAATPEGSPKEAVLVEIGVLLDQAHSWRERSRREQHANRAAELAEQVFEQYGRCQHDYFSDVLEKVSGRVAEIYSKLHPGEGLAGVGVEPWGTKGVELAVSFHGSRQKPPHGVLSESHLHSLAIALFLAMAETFNARLDFLVLDDVVNSFDVDHRAQLASLLARDFSHRQLMVLTHDRLFFERLRTLAPAWKRIEFTSWDYQDGPRTKEYRSAEWVQEALDVMRAGDPVGGAQKGRRALEELLQEICEGLAVPLPFRRGVQNDHRMVGETLSGLRSVLKDRAKELYRTSAKTLLDDLEADLLAALNPAVHAGPAAPSAAEVSAALERVAQLDAMWTCQGCRTRVWHRRGAERSTCRCRKTVFPAP